MSQSSNSKMNANIFAELSTITGDNKGTSTAAERGMKRAASDLLEGQVKKIMAENPSSEEQASNAVPKCFDQPRFINASQMALHARSSIQMIPEISDQELLEMAIEFEKKHPQ